MKLQKIILYKQLALVLSLCALVVWCIFGTGASLAWFTDSSPDINNIFHIADFELVVSHLLTDEKWERIDNKTKIFDEKALYEPGYVQIVYLKVENLGERVFKFRMGVNVNGYVEGNNVFGQRFMLQDYLKFGITIADSEEEIKNKVSNRSKICKIADMPLHNYDTESTILSPNAIKYIALIVRMPEEVDNIANYCGNDIPKVELGITVKADQIIN